MKRRSFFCKYSLMYSLVFIEPNVTNDFPDLPQLQKACYTRNFLAIYNIKVLQQKLRKFCQHIRFVVHYTTWLFFYMKFGFNFRALFLAYKFFAAFLFGTFWTLYVINSALALNFRTK